MEAFASLWDRLAERRIDTGDRHLFPVCVDGGRPFFN